MASVLANTQLNINFRRSLRGNSWDMWLELVNRLMHVSLSNTPDVFVWRLTNSGLFTVKSMYLDLLNEHPKFTQKYIWKLRVPLKIKIFLWLLRRKVILTKDNLAKRNWIGDQKCCFCEHDESVQHLFLECHVARSIWRIIHMSFGLAPPTNITNLFGNWLKGIPKIVVKNIRVGVAAVLWTIWNVRNDLVFNKKKFTSFLQVIPLATHWIHMWSYLQPEDKRKVMVSGCNTLEMVAKDLYNQCGWRFHRRLAL